MDFLASTHFHIFTWVVGILLFLITAVMANGSKGRKITHMVARLFYVLILISGILLFVKGMDYDQGALYGIKFLFGLAAIGLMEMVLVRSGKGKKASTFAVLLFIVVIIAMFLGFKLPMGISWFA